MKRIIIIILSFILIKNNIFFGAAIIENQKCTELSEEQKIKAAKDDKMNSEEKSKREDVILSPDKIKLTPLQNAALQQIVTHTGLSKDEARVIASYIEEFNQQATKDLVDMLSKSNDLSSEQIIKKINEQVKKGADVNGYLMKNKEYQNTIPLWIVICRFVLKPGIDNIFASLINNGANVNISKTSELPDNFIHNTLFRFLLNLYGSFSYEENIKIKEIMNVMKLLLDIGIDQNFIIEEGKGQNVTRMTYLIYAALSGYSEVVSLLLNNGADPDIGNYKGLKFEELIQTGPYYSKVKKVYENWKNSKNS